MQKICKIRKISIFQCEIPLYVPVVIRGEVCTCKKTLIMKVEDFLNHEYWGEVVFLPPTERKLWEKVRWFEKNHKLLLGRINTDTNEFPPELKFAVDHSLPISMMCSNKNESSNVLLKVNALLVGGIESMRERARKKYARGFSIFKLKLGEYTVSDAIKIFCQVREILGDECEFVIDLNRRWEINQTLHFVEQIYSEKILYLEDPVSTVQELEEYLNSSPIKMGMDEFLQPLSHNLKKLCEQFPEKIVCVMKPSVIYGTEIWNYMISIPNLSKVFTSAWESGIGLWGLINLIFSHKNALKFVGLDTYSYLTYDLIDPELEKDLPFLSSKIFEQRIRIKQDRLNLIGYWETE